MTAIPVATPVRNIQNINVVSASAITKKLDQCLKILYPDPTSTPTPTSTTDDLPAVSISARSATASKAITIAEILKRRISEKGDQWYQYTILSSVDIEKKEQLQQPQSKSTRREQNYKKRDNQEGNKKNSDEIEDVDEGGDIEEEEEEDGDGEDPYSVLEEKVPPKKRKVPLLTIYISRSALPEFKKLYSEQSSCP